MTAWPAAKELRLEGSVEGVIGAAVLAVAVATDAGYLWLAGIVTAVLLAATAWRARVEARALAAAEPAPADTRTATWLQFAVRLPLTIASALCTAVIGFVFPPALSLAVALLFGTALLAFARAVVISRFERTHGGVVVRVREDTFGPEQYFVLAH